MKKLILLAMIFVMACAILPAQNILRMESSLICMYNNAGDEIAIMGTPHFGSRLYWSYIYDRALDYPVVIHDAIDRFPRLMQTYKIAARIMGVLYQADYKHNVPSESQWIPVDISTDEMNTILNRSDIDGQNMKLLYQLFDWRNRYLYKKEIIDYYNYVKNYAEDPVISLRVKQKCDAAVQYRQVLLLVGEGHVRHIVKELKARGYQSTIDMNMYPLM